MISGGTLQDSASTEGRCVWVIGHSLGHGMIESGEDANRPHGALLQLQNRRHERAALELPALRRTALSLARVGLRDEAVREHGHDT